MKTLKKFLLPIVVTAFVSAFPSSASKAQAETCTLDSSGTCKCVALTQGGSVIGYACVTGESMTAKCVCP